MCTGGGRILRRAGGVCLPASDRNAAPPRDQNGTRLVRPNLGRFPSGTMAVPACPAPLETDRWSLQQRTYGVLHSHHADDERLLIRTPLRSGCPYPHRFRGPLHAPRPRELHAVADEGDAPRAGPAVRGGKRTPHRERCRRDPGRRPRCRGVGRLAGMILLRVDPVVAAGSRILNAHTALPWATTIRARPWCEAAQTVGGSPSPAATPPVPRCLAPHPM